MLSGQGTAPALATIATFARSGFPRIPTGPGPDAHLSFTVPGAVGAYLKLLETFGRRPIFEVLAPALEYAEEGFPMYAICALSPWRRSGVLSSWAGAAGWRTVPAARARGNFEEIGGRRRTGWG